MNELLKGLGNAYAEEEILLFADSAGWHKSKELQSPANIHLALLPPYSPELNPVEHLRDYIREQKGFNNHSFLCMEELENHLGGRAQKPARRKRVYPLIVYLQLNAATLIAVWYKTIRPVLVRLAV